MPSQSMAMSLGGGLRWLSRSERKRISETMRLDGIRAAIRLKKVLLKRRARHLK